ncbi:MAG: AmmeMemoRadiSam system radical SAM enzyme [Candidatus Heimdallarchaeota archaeon]|nr:AmmeMemoRadiSam system radical SAM enzyme [Candidatus Heimdallarchaeota archaeon]
MHLQSDLDVNTINGTLFTQLEENTVQCHACAHRCRIREGKRGICRVRFNKGGKLRVPYGYVAALHNDPIEKKPFYHAYPNSYAMSIGMMGCNLRCNFCQNWQISQTLRDPDAGVRPRQANIEDIINQAIASKSRSIISTYNEPLITSEWAHDIFSKAKEHNMATGFVSSGNTTPEVLDYLRPVTDLYKIDLKTFDENNYKSLGADLDSILKSIENVYRKGFWLELVTLLIPDFNDSTKELTAMAEYIADLDPHIPWHLSAYHADYKMQNRNTTMNDLEVAAEIGRKAGLKYIYAGNIYKGNNYRDTRCHACGNTVVERRGFMVTKYSIVNGSCPKCGEGIPGIWEDPPERKRFYL